VIDTHAHLDACGEPAHALLERARSAGVTRVIAIGSGIDSSRAAVALAGQEDGVFATVGVHPHDAGGADAGRLGELTALLEDERVVAVGETGLDFYRDLAPRGAQRELFEAHLELAARVTKAAVVHSRAADAETAHALSSFPGTVVLHCFSSPDLLPAALERGYYVSFAGNVSFPKADELRAAAREVPADRILVETDSPYLSPQPVRGRPNEPAHVVHTLMAVAAARGEDADELAQRIDENANAAFGIR
jgi:TatD DNase family protein